MISTPSDPVQEWRDRLHKLALTLLNEDITISDGMSVPNQIVTIPLDFERQNEEVISGRVEQYRSPLLLACEVTTLFLFKSKRKLYRETPDRV